MCEQVATWRGHCNWVLEMSPSVQLITHPDLLWRWQCKSYMSISVQLFVTQCLAVSCSTVSSCIFVPSLTFPFLQLMPMSRKHGSVHPLPHTFSWVKVGKGIPVTGRGGPQGCETSRIPAFSRQSAHIWRWGCQPYAPAALYPPGRFLVLISVRGWVDPKAIVRLEELGQLKKSTSSGFDPASVLLVA
jgi:hypothetical protein